MRSVKKWILTILLYGILSLLFVVRTLAGSDDPIFDSLNAENSLIMRAPGIFCCLKMLYGRVSYNNFLIFLLRSFGR